MAFEQKITVAPTALLQQALEEGSAQVGVIGMGYVGLPLALLFARPGYHTTGFDIDQIKVEKLEAGHTYIRYIPAAAIGEAINQNRFWVPLTSRNWRG